MTSTPERREAVILNAELRNFTRLSEMLPPEKVLELANDFFSFCGMAITANAGKVLSVQNDALVGAFATGSRKEYAHRALKSAQDLQREFGLLGEQWKRDYGLQAAISAAVHIGEAVFGMGGPIAHRQFVAFGDCVSITERLMHRARAGEVILSLDFMKALGTTAQILGAEELPPLELHKRPPVIIYGMALEKRLDFT
ncbi:MAG TPA: adenylate/guanylate cyclase domain-containing protein [Burkholderiales bacterium]|nr:adenylate/guanylate cyclase domain-containing protein [Burkholderiales bacterium]